MQKIISLLVALCVLAACPLAGAEGKAPEGKPWINSNLLDSIPAERPAPEDSFDLYANYDAYREAKDKGITDTQEDPTPLTDEELERFQKKEKRKVTIIGEIIDFIISFFR